MTPLLESITISDFRSIRGLITVPLNAPIVLIHGHNGAGKTSLLSAIELGLTGAVASLERADAGYRSHLVHKDAQSSRIELSTANLGTNKTNFSVSNATITGKALLDQDKARFFTERAFLAQSTLGRLLELYEDKDARKGDSPLTRFVKNLLGLDQLDALIDGLYDAGNVRRLRTTVPAYWDVRETLPELEKRLKELEQQESTSQRSLDAVNARLEPLLTQLQIAPPAAGDLNGLRAMLSNDEEEQYLQIWAAWRRELLALMQQWTTSAEGNVSNETINQLESDVNAKNRAYAGWQNDHGSVLYSLLSEISQSFPNIPDPSSVGYAPSHHAASEAVRRETERVNAILAADAADTTRSGELVTAIESANARITALDQQISAHVSSASSLAQALSTVLPHVHGNDCPVCRRDFAEVSPTPLPAFVSGQIARLTESAGSLQTLSQEKSNTQIQLATLTRERDSISTRLLSIETRNSTRTLQANLVNFTQRLAATAAAAIDGQQMMTEAASSARALSEARGQSQIRESVRTRIGEVAIALSVAPLGTAEPIEQAIARFTAYISTQERILLDRQSARKATAQCLSEIETMKLRMETAISEKQILTANISRLEAGKRQADQQISDAKELAKIAGETRTQIVRNVFNQSLNSIWKDLFVRLAPEEPFIPAFALPENQTGPVEAVLETLYRSGGKGGNPRAMLSAGNLNTAALTLFLALHLSAAPSLPWLIIDDPVQSMDEVHISQFAALLRTLSKQHGRQVIIAVHEKPLFDYLSLELAPAFLSDRLITIELSRSSNGGTVVDYRPSVWVPDNAFAA